MTQVTTPHGGMNISGALRANGGVLFDLFFGLILGLLIHNLLLKIDLPELLSMTFAAVFGFAYPLLSHREVIPGLGRWALGLHRYSYSEIEEYQGKGTLVVYEPLNKKVYTARAIISATILVMLYFITAYFSGGEGIA